MRLKLSDLQQVVEEATREKKAVDSFCNEIKAVFGPTVMAADDLETLVEQAHYRLDVLERTGRINYISFPTAAAVPLSNHKNAAVRRLVARLLPEEFSSQFINDKNPSVRASAAQKVSFKLLKETVRLRPNDTVLQDALELRALTERADSALEAAAESPEGSDLLSDGWYKKTAHKLIQDYGRTLDTGWVPAAVTQLCSAMRASNRFNIDAYKLMKKVVECLTEIEEERFESLKESLQVSTVQEYKESVDPVQQLTESRCSAQEYISMANKVFNISMSSIPRSLQKFHISEGISRQVSIPTSGMLPRRGPFRYIDENALDTYVKHWNTLHSLQGNTYKLAWSPHPESQNKFSFNLVLK
jgi:hypothetical protein